MAGAWSKHRWQIWNQTQHPYKHNLAEFGYANPAMPGVDNVEKAMDWVLAVLYPLSQSAVATPTDLPPDAAVTFSSGLVQGAHASYGLEDLVYFTTTGTLPTGVLPNVTYKIVDLTGGLSLEDLNGNTVTPVGAGTGVHTMHNVNNAYRVVFDDGDGKAAGYRYEQREGEASPSWHKIYDMDWSEDNIIAQFMNITQDLYVYKGGKMDTDPLGVPITGDNAGQHIYGGDQANSNLTLHANSGDGVGPQTGFVQVTDDFRPLIDNTNALGELTKRFTELYLSNLVSVATMTIQSGSITDTTGAISFGDENLTTTGDISADDVSATSGVHVNGQMHVTPTQITNTTGTISFDDENLVTTGNVTADAFLLQGTGSIIEQPDGDLQIDSGTDEIDFNNNILKNIASIDAGTITADQLTVDDLTLDNNDISSVSAIELRPDISDPNVNIHGKLNVTTDADIVGTTSVDTLVVDTQITATGAQVVVDSTKTLNAENILSEQIGTVADPVQNIVADTLVAPNGDTELVQDIVDFPFTATLQDEVPHWDTGTQKFINKLIDFPEHGELVGLADDDHTQYALLAGRGTGQELAGAASATPGDLTLIGTASSTNTHSIILKDKIVPFTTAAFGVSWTGYDIGSSTLNFNNLYSRGEHFGLRYENVAGLPLANAANIGRVVFDTTTNAHYVDVGGAWKAMMHTDAYTSVESGTGITLAANLKNVVNLTNASLVSIADIAITSGVSGADYKVLVNKTGNAVVIKNNATIITGTGLDFTLGNDASTTLFYDGAAWRLMVGASSATGLVSRNTFSTPLSTAAPISITTDKEQEAYISTVTHTNTEAVIFPRRWTPVKWIPERQLFITVGQRIPPTDLNTNRFATSTDGITWTLSGVAIDVGWTAVAYSPELSKFVALSYSSNTVAYSADGLTWTSGNTLISAPYNDLVWSPVLRLFVAVGDTGSGYISTSPDGVSWTARTPATNNIGKVLWIDSLNMFVTMGGGAGMGVGSPYQYSYDGITWTLGTGVGPSTRMVWVEKHKVLVASSTFSGGNLIYRSTNGRTWTVSLVSAPTMNNATLLDYFDTHDCLVAVSYDTVAANMKYISSFDGGLTWSSSGIVVTNTIGVGRWVGRLGRFVGTAFFASQDFRVYVIQFSDLSIDNGVLEGQKLTLIGTTGFASPQIKSSGNIVHNVGTGVFADYLYKYRRLTFSWDSVNSKWFNVT